MPKRPKLPVQITIAVTEGDRHVGRITLDYFERRVLARVLREVAAQIEAEDRELSGADLRGVLKLFD